MKKMMMGLLLVSCMAGSAMSADNTIQQKAKKLVKSVQDGCSVELNSFCKDVTPGEGRKLACLYAFEDKLSSQCEYALYDAASQLERAVVKLKHVANACSDDIDKNCSAVAPGEGRILDCLKKSGNKNSSTCNQALKDTGVTK